MERYIQQLIEDLRAAAQKTPAPGELWNSVDMDDPGEVEDMAHVEQFLYGTPQKLSEIVRIEKVQPRGGPLPPIEKLKTLPGFRTLEGLVVEMELLLKAYHFVPYFPEGLPAAIKYHLLREKWVGSPKRQRPGICRSRVGPPSGSAYRVLRLLSGHLPLPPGVLRVPEAGRGGGWTTG